MALTPEQMFPKSLGLIREELLKAGEILIRVLHPFGWSPWMSIKEFKEKYAGKNIKAIEISELVTWEQLINSFK